MMMSTGTAVRLISSDTTNRYPHCQPQRPDVCPTSSCPSALPRDPVPSIIPVTVEIAREWTPFCFPRSAAHTLDMRLFSELMKKPRENMDAKSMKELIS